MVGPPTYSQVEGAPGTDGKRCGSLTQKYSYTVQSRYKDIKMSRVHPYTVDICVTRYSTCLICVGRDEAGAKVCGLKTGAQSNRD